MKIPRILFVPIVVLAIVALSFGVWGLAVLFGALNPNAWGFFTGFGIMGLGIVYVGFRQIWWRITKTGDYEHLKKKE